MFEKLPNISLNTRASYDQVADEYVRRIFDELKDKPFDRQVLDRFCQIVSPDETVCDMGCGPGQVAHYLHANGRAVSGVDLSEGLLERARELTLGVEFLHGDMRSLTAPDRHWGGIVAFYSLVHIHSLEMISTLKELFRVLKPGGTFLSSFHIGNKTIHLDKWWGKEVCLDFHFFKPTEITFALEQAGFQIDEVLERDPYPNIEIPTKRCYIFAHRPEENAYREQLDSEQNLLI